jgi:hypothetical protein
MCAPNRPVATSAPELGEPRHHLVDQPLGLLGCRGRHVGGPATLRGVAVQGELADHEDPGTEVGRRAVHPSLVVVEAPQVPQLVGQSACLLLVVIVGRPDQDEQARPDAARLLGAAVDAGGHERLVDPLHHRSHAPSSPSPSSAC